MTLTLSLVATLGLWARRSRGIIKNILNLDTVQLEWQANSQKAGKITAEPFILKDKIIEGTLSVVPLYRLEYMEHGTWLYIDNLVVVLLAREQVIKLFFYFDSIVTQNLLTEIHKLR